MTISKKKELCPRCQFAGNRQFGTGARERAKGVKMKKGKRTNAEETSEIWRGS